ncbi:RagB/SusD family nutrient uptake outer membrane protein [Saccharicrinis aurantiacus]|uniref:RagB/SusD family nutrient uptake outer membrane protein n=1 Tax=Saccharicrinis aurantiacus TaxID=1849719 RepID=UPI00094F5018|nr:RagB/SusD family nutrient uptake outer membrane protein [Saccharicrinis aurantiacus]
MNYKIFLLVSVFVGGLLLHSCSDDELQQINPNKITTEVFWETQADCELGINAIYNAFKDRNLMALRVESQRSDMAHKYQNDAENSYYLKTYNNSKSDIQNKWASLYTGVFRANQALIGLNKFKELNPDVNEEMWNNWRGQALFFRGLFYFYLHSSFNNGEVVIRDTIPEVIADFQIPVSSSKDVFNFFMTDLKAAYTEGILPNTWSKGNEGRITRGAVAAVIGQAYLYQENYDSAKVYLGDVINNTAYAYALTDDLKENVSSTNELNSEAILEIVYSENLKPEETANSGDGVSSKYGDDVSPIETQWGQAAMYPAYWLQMAYKEDPMDVNDPRNLTPQIDIVSGDPVLDENGEVIMELRRYNQRASAYIAFVDDEATQYYLARTCLAWNFNNKSTAAFKMMSNCNEYSYIDANRSNSENYKSGVNYRVLRLADIFLMYAETLIEGGSNESGVTEALSYINKVRYRSALQLLGPSTGEFASSTFDEETYDAQKVMDQLMYVERPLEISILGHASRHMDLRRWGIYEERFQELSQLRYSFGSYPEEIWSDNTDGTRKFLYPKAEDAPYDPITKKNYIRWGSILYYDSYFDNAVGWDGKPAGDDKFDIEYQASAANYIESQHAYWPIPLVEETSNPNIYNK